MAHLPQSGDSDDPHRGQPIETAGAPPQAAAAAVIMLHGRGSTAQQILRLVDEFYHHGVVYLAPQAARNRWYPRSGYGPIADNEPWFSSALSQVSTAVEMATDLGIGPERVLLFGFSQGACLASEFVARSPRQYGGLIALSGSLLGSETGTEYTGSLAGAPVFFGCSTDDPYVAAERIRESQTVFERLDGEVTARFYDNLGHAINDDEIEMTNTFIERLVSAE
jgi:phospholipase/carboxylesterase